MPTRSTRQEPDASTAADPAPDVPIAVSLNASELAALDAWIAEHPDRPARDEAIRRLLTCALIEHPGQ